MAIRLTPVTSLSVLRVKRNFETIAREAESLQHPKDATYLTSAPSTADLDELQSVYVETGGNMYRYMKIGGALYRVQLTAV